MLNVCRVRRWFVPGLLYIGLLFAQCKAQDKTAALASVGLQAKDVVVSQFVVNTEAVEPVTGKPFAADGKWSVSEYRPTDCPRTTETCIKLIYSVPNTRVVCEWDVLLLGDGSSGQVLSENDNAARYFLVRLNSLDSNELAINLPPPVYPEALRSRAAGLNLVLRVNVGTDGNVENVQPIGGFMLIISKGKAFVEPTIQAAKQWRFKPYMIGSRAVKFQTTITVHADQGTFAK